MGGFYLALVRSLFTTVVSRDRHKHIAIPPWDLWQFCIKTKPCKSKKHCPKGRKYKPWKPESSYKSCQQESQWHAFIQEREKTNLTTLNDARLIDEFGPEIVQ